MAIGKTFKFDLLRLICGFSDVVEMAEAATVPVINALSNSHHPLQALADYMILQETFKART